MTGERKILLVVGLGNPGRQYEETRHNAGYLVVELLAFRFSVSLSQKKFNARWGTGQLAGSKTTLFQPLSYMNRSGEPVGQFVRYFGISADQILVVHDDLDLPSGRIRLARGGGAGGHRGILSIIEHLGTTNFARLKLGVGRPAHGEPVEDFVLNVPYAHERDEFRSMIARGGEAVEVVLASGLEVAMNRYNASPAQVRTQSQAPSGRNGSG